MLWSKKQPDKAAPAPTVTGVSARKVDGGAIVTATCGAWVITREYTSPTDKPPEKFAAMAESDLRAAGFEVSRV